MTTQSTSTKTVTTQMFRGNSSSSVVNTSSNSLLAGELELVRLKDEISKALASINPNEYALSEGFIFRPLQSSTLKAVHALTIETGRNSFDDFVKPENASLSYEGEGYKTTRDRLIALLREEDGDECRPTSHSFDTAWKLITDATRQLQKNFPKAYVAADDEGGIRLRWRSLDKIREVSLYCPSSNSENAYVYHELGDEYDADYKVSGLALAGWLSWLSQNK